MTERTRADELAELVCALFGWTAGPDTSERSLALHQLWTEWLRERHGPGTYLPRDYPQLSDEYIGALARRREAIRARTLAEIEKLIVIEPADPLL